MLHRRRFGRRQRRPQDLLAEGERDAAALVEVVGGLLTGSLRTTLLTDDRDDDGEALESLVQKERQCQSCRQRQRRCTRRQARAH